MDSPPSSLLLPLRALSVMQPWCWGLVKGLKPPENRTWAPPAGAFGGRVALHASQKVDRGGLASFAAILRRPDLAGRLAGAVRLNDMPLGALTGSARLAGAVRVEEQGGALRAVEVRGDLSPEQVRLVLESPWSVGPWCWLFADALEVAPIPAKGALGLWRVPEELVDAFRRAEARAAERIAV